MNLLSRSFFIVICFSPLCPTLLWADWPFVRGDAQASGFTRVALPDKPEVVWKHTLTDSGFEATALLVDNRVYLGDFDGTFYCFSLSTGDLHWKQKFKDCGFTSAAAIAEKKIVVSDFNGFVRCLRTQDGKEIWTYEATSESYAAPNIHKGVVLLTLEAGELLALDFKTGKRLWQYRIEAPLRCWPAVVEGKVLLAGCDQRFHAIDFSTGVEASGIDIDNQTGSTSAVMGSDVFFGTESGTFYAINAKTMKVLWQYHPSKQIQPIRAAAAVTRHCVIYPNQGKLVTALNPTNGKPLWTFSVRSRVESSPVIAGGRAYLPTKRGRLYAVDTLTGKEVWQYQAGGAFLASPAVADGKLVLGNEDGVLYCFGEKPRKLATD